MERWCLFVYVDMSYAYKAHNIQQQQIQSPTCAEAAITKQQCSLSNFCLLHN